MRAKKDAFTAKLVGGLFWDDGEPRKRFERSIGEVVNTCIVLPGNVIRVALWRV